LFADSYVHNGAQFNEERPRTRLWEAHEIDAFMSKMAQDPNVTQRMTQEIRKATRPGSTNENGINATLREYDHLVTTLQQVRHKPLSALTNEQHTDLVNTIARLSHFVTDMCNPFHNSFTNWMLYQSDYGAHMRFESEFSLRNAKEKEQFQIWETQFKKAYHTVKSNTKEGHVEDRTPLNKFFEWAFPQREAMGLAQAPELARKLKHEHKLANPDSPDPQFNERSDLREFLIQRTVWGANKVRDMYYEEQALRAHYANAPDEYQKALEAKWKPIAEKSIVDSGIVLKNILELAWNQARTSEQHPKGSVQPSMPIRLPGLQGERTYFSVPTA
jgi:hypothetical protein